MRTCTCLLPNFSPLTNLLLTHPVTQQTECAHFGKVVSVIIPRPPSIGTLEKDFTGGVGKVFVEMATEEEAKTTLVNLKGRKFDGKWVDVKFYPAQSFQAKHYGVVLPNIVITASGPTTIGSIVGRGGGSSTMGMTMGGGVGGGLAMPTLNVAALGVTLGHGGPGR